MFNVMYRVVKKKPHAAFVSNNEIDIMISNTAKFLTITFHTTIVIFHLCYICCV